MRIMSTRVRRLRACGAAFVLATSAGLIPSLAVAADGPIADTKVWCGEAAKMIGDKDTQKFFDSFVFASGGLIDRPSVEQAFASLPPALSREGAFISGDFLVEKAYGETLSRAWFLIQFETASSSCGAREPSAARAGSSSTSPTTTKRTTCACRDGGAASSDSGDSGNIERTAKCSMQ
jgi:hypothetical protein